MQLLGNEQTQEEFTQLLNYIYQNNGVGLVVSPPLLGSTCRMKKSMDILAQNVTKPMNPILTDGASQVNPANEWQAALLKYKVIENPRIAQPSTTHVQDFKPIYIDLRSIQTRSELILTIALALNMESFPKFESLQEELDYCLKSRELCTMLILDHVSKLAARFLYELLSSVLESIGIIIIAECQLNLSDLITEKQKQAMEKKESTSAKIAGISFGSSKENNTFTTSDSKFEETIVAKAFIEEIREFASLLSLVYEENSNHLLPTANTAMMNATSPDAKRILIYSHTLSFRETFTMIKNLQVKGKAVISDGVPESPLPPPVSTPSSSTATTPPMVPNTDIILDLAKGIPGLIQVTHSLEGKLLRSLQETVGKLSRSSNLLSMQPILNRYILAGRAFATVLTVYYELLKVLPSLLSTSSVLALRQFTKLYQKGVDRHRQTIAGRRKGLGDSADSVDDDEEEEEEEALEALVNDWEFEHTLLFKHNSVMGHLKVMRKDLLEIGMRSEDLGLLQQLQIFIPLFHVESAPPPSSTTASELKPEVNVKESVDVSKSHSEDTAVSGRIRKRPDPLNLSTDSQAPSIGSTSNRSQQSQQSHHLNSIEDYHIFSIPIYILELMQLVWSEEIAAMQSVPTTPSTSASTNRGPSSSRALMSSQRFLTDCILRNHLELFLTAFQEHSMLHLLCTIPELQKYPCVNEAMIIVKDQLVDLSYLFHQLIAIVFPQIAAIALQTDAALCSASSVSTIVASLLRKTSAFANPVLTTAAMKSRSKEETEEEEDHELGGLRILDDLEDNFEEESIMLIVGFAILSFGEEILQMWFPLHENIVLITILAKILLRWRMKDLQQLPQHPLLKQLLVSLLPPGMNHFPVEDQELYLPFAILITYASETMFALWKTYYWSNSWIASTIQNPLGNLAASTSFTGNDLIYTSINDLMCHAMEKLFAWQELLMKQIYQTLPKLELKGNTGSKSVDNVEEKEGGMEAGLPSVSRSLSGSIGGAVIGSGGGSGSVTGTNTATAKAIVYHYYYLQCKQITVSSEFHQLQMISQQLSHAKERQLSIPEIFPVILSQITRLTNIHLQRLQTSIAQFQQEFYSLSKLQMKIYLQNIMTRLSEIMTFNPQSDSLLHPATGTAPAVNAQSFSISQSFDEDQNDGSGSVQLRESFFSSYSKDLWLKQRLYIIKIFESQANTYLASAFLLLSFVYRYYPAIAKGITNQASTTAVGGGGGRGGGVEKEMMPLLYLYHANYLCTFQDKLLFYQSLFQEVQAEYDHRCSVKPDVRFYPQIVVTTDHNTDKEEGDSDNQPEPTKQEATTLDEVEGLGLQQQQIEQKQSICQTILVYFTQTMEEYTTIYGPEAMLATQCMVYLIALHQIEYTFFTPSELVALIPYYEKVLVENRQNCDLSLFHYRKLLLSTSTTTNFIRLSPNTATATTTTAQTPSASSPPRSGNAAIKPFPFSPRQSSRNTTTTATATTTEEDKKEPEQGTIQVRVNMNLYEIKLMFSYLQYLLGKYNLAMVQQEILKNQTTTMSPHVIETQHYISLALFQTGYETLLSIQRNEAGNALLINLMVAQLQLLSQDEKQKRVKTELFQQLLSHFVDCLHYERQALQEKLVSMIQSLLFHSTISVSSQPDSSFYGVEESTLDDISVSINVRTPLKTPGAEGAREEEASPLPQRNRTIYYIDSSVRATLRSGIELAYTLQQLLHQCAKLYEEREMFEAASLIYKELLYMYRDLHALVTLDMIELFPMDTTTSSTNNSNSSSVKKESKSAKQGSSKSKRAVKEESEDEDEDSIDDEALQQFDQFYSSMNPLLYQELLQLFTSISQQFPPIDQALASTLLQLGTAFCYYPIDPSVLLQQTNSHNRSDFSSLQQSLHLPIPLYYHRLYDQYALNPRLLSYYTLQEEVRTTHHQYLPYFQAIRALETAKQLYQHLYEESQKQPDQKPQYEDLQILARHFLTIYRELALLYLRNREYEKARQCHQWIQQLLLEVSGFVSILEIADVQVEYGIVLFHLGDYLESQIFFQQSIDYYRQFYLQEVTQIPLSYMALRQSRNGKGEVEEVKDANSHNNTQTTPTTTATDKTLFLFIQRKLIFAYLGKASSLLEEGDYELAQTAIEYTLSLIYEYYQRDSEIYCLELTIALLILASIHHYYHEYEDALSCYQRIEQIHRKLQMTETVEMAKLYHNQATVYDDMGKQSEAKGYYEKAVVLLIQRHSTQFQQLLSTLEGLHGLLLEMGLETEANSIEQYAEDVQTRIKKYDEEEALRLQTLQKSLRSQNTWLSQVEEWSYQQRRSHLLHQRRASNMTSSSSRPGSDGGSERSGVITGSPSLTFRKPNLSTAASPVMASGNKRHLKKTDSFKKRLRDSYYLKHQPPHRSPYSKGGGEGKSEHSHHHAHRDEENPHHHIEPDLEVNHTYKQSFLNTTTTTPGGGVERRSAFDMNRIFADGLLFTSLTEEDIAGNTTASSITASNNTGRRSRTSSADRDNVMELGGSSGTTATARRRSSGSGSSSRLHLFARRRGRERETTGVGEYEADEEEDRRYRGNSREDVDEEEEEQNLPSGNCTIH